MEVLQGKDHLGDDEASSGLCEFLANSYKLGQIAVRTVVQSQVQVLGCLEGEMKGDDEGVVNFLQNCCLTYRVFQLFLFD